MEGYVSISIKKELRDLLAEKKGDKSFSTLLEAMVKNYKEINEVGAIIGEILVIKDRLDKIEAFIDSHTAS